MISSAECSCLTLQLQLQGITPVVSSPAEKEWDTAASSEAAQLVGIELFSEGDVLPALNIRKVKLQTIVRAPSRQQAQSLHLTLSASVHHDHGGYCSGTSDEQGLVYALLMECPNRCSSASAACNVKGRNIDAPPVTLPQLLHLLFSIDAMCICNAISPATGNMRAAKRMALLLPIGTTCAHLYIDPSNTRTGILASLCASNLCSALPREMRNWSLSRIIDRCAKRTARTLGIQSADPQPQQKGLTTRTGSSKAAAAVAAVAGQRRAAQRGQQSTTESDVQVCKRKSTSAAALDDFRTQVKLANQSNQLILGEDGMNPHPISNFQSSAATPLTGSSMPVVNRETYYSAETDGETPASGCAEVPLNRSSLTEVPAASSNSTVGVSTRNRSRGQSLEEGSPSSAGTAPSSTRLNTSELQQGTEVLNFYISATGFDEEDHENFTANRIMSDQDSADEESRLFSKLVDDNSSAGISTHSSKCESFNKVRIATVTMAANGDSKISTGSDSFKLSQDSINSNEQQSNADYSQIPCAATDPNVHAEKRSSQDQQGLFASVMSAASQLTTNVFQRLFPSPPDANNILHEQKSDTVNVDNQSQLCIVKSKEFEEQLVRDDNKTTDGPIHDEEDDDVAECGVESSGNGCYESSRMLRLSRRGSTKALSLEPPADFPHEELSKLDTIRLVLTKKKQQQMLPSEVKALLLHCVLYRSIAPMNAAIEILCVIYQLHRNASKQRIRKSTAKKSMLFSSLQQLTRRLAAVVKVRIAGEASVHRAVVIAHALQIFLYMEFHFTLIPLLTEDERTLVSTLFNEKEEFANQCNRLAMMLGSPTCTIDLLNWLVTFTLKEEDESQRISSSEGMSESASTQVPQLLVDESSNDSAASSVQEKTLTEKFVAALLDMYKVNSEIGRAELAVQWQTVRDTLLQFDSRFQRRKISPEKAPQEVNDRLQDRSFTGTERVSVVPVALEKMASRRKLSSSLQDATRQDAVSSFGDISRQSSAPAISKIGSGRHAAAQLKRTNSIIGERKRIIGHRIDMGTRKRVRIVPPVGTVQRKSAESKQGDTRNDFSIDSTPSTSCRRQNGDFDPSDYSALAHLYASQESAQKSLPDRNVIGDTPYAASKLSTGSSMCYSRSQDPAKHDLVGDMVCSPMLLCERDSYLQSSLGSLHTSPLFSRGGRSGSISSPPVQSRSAESSVDWSRYVISSTPMDGLKHQSVPASTMEGSEIDRNDEIINPWENQNHSGHIPEGLYSKSPIISEASSGTVAEDTSFRVRRSLRSGFEQQATNQHSLRRAGNSSFLHSDTRTPDKLPNQ